MSEWSDAVREFRQAVAVLHASQGSGGAGPAGGAGPVGGNLNGQQQLSALQGLFGQTSQGARQAATDLDAADRGAQRFLGNFSQARIASLGLNGLHTALNLVSNEAGNVIETVSGFERWQQSLGRLDGSRPTLTGMANDFGDLRKEIELLAFGPAIDTLEKRLTSDVTPSGKSTLEQAADGIGSALSGAVDWVFDLNAGIADLQNNLRNALGTNANPLFDMGAGAPVNNQYKEYIQSLHEAGVEVQTLTGYLTRLDAEAGDLRANYEAQVKPLQTQLDLLNKQYEAAQRKKALTDAERNVAREQALAVDVFSAAGQAANAALPDDQQRLQDLRDAQKHQVQVDDLNARLDAASADYSARRADLNKRQSDAQRDLSRARAGNSIEEQARQEQRDAAAQAAGAFKAAHRLPYDNDYSSGTPPFLPGTNGTNGPVYGGGLYTSTGGLAPTVNVNLSLNGATLGGNKAWVKGMLEDPEVKTWLSQAAAGR